MTGDAPGEWGSGSHERPNAGARLTSCPLPSILGEPRQEGAEHSRGAGIMSRRRRNSTHRRCEFGPCRSVLLGVAAIFLGHSAPARAAAGVEAEENAGVVRGEWDAISPEYDTGMGLPALRLDEHLGVPGSIVGVFTPPFATPEDAAGLDRERAEAAAWDFVSAYATLLAGVVRPPLWTGPP